MCSPRVARDLNLGHNSWLTAPSHPFPQHTSFASEAACASLQPQRAARVAWAIRGMDEGCAARIQQPRRFLNPYWARLTDEEHNTLPRPGRARNLAPTKHTTVQRAAVLASPLDGVAGIGGAAIA